MDEKNSFLDSYKKQNSDAIDAGQPPSDQPETGLRYVEKSDFVPVRPVVPADVGTSKRRKSLLPVIIICVTLLLIAAGLVCYFTRGTAVIDLTGYKLSDAQIWAGEKGINLQVTEQYNDEYDEDFVFAQEPEAGGELAKGGFLRIYVSLGHDLNVMLDLPDIQAMTMSEIEAWAEANFMTKVRITTEYSSLVATGRVISFEINDNTVLDKVRRNTPVYVIISKGPEPASTEPVTVPDFTAMTVSQAQQFADDNGLGLVITEVFDNDVPTGTIMDQSVDADQSVAAGTEITLTVSKGKEVRVPNFATYTRERAAMVASEMGIAVNAVDKYSSKSTGGFISQSIAAGSLYTAGDVVELSYSLGNKVQVSNYVGQSVSAIQLWADELNRQGAGIKLSITRTQNDAPKDTVIYQDKANTSLTIGSTIKITVSLGKKVFVPDLVAPTGSGYDQAVLRDDATAACQALGLVVIFVEEAKTGRLPGEVWSQSIAAGTEVYEGSTITLKYCPVKSTLDIPDFTGMTEQEIRDAGWLNKLDITFVVSDYPVDGHDGTVYQQSLPVGHTYAYGTKISISIGMPLTP